MRAFTLDSFDSPARLHDEMRGPVPGDAELLVRVRTSSVNPADAAVANAALQGMLEHEFPVTLGRDFAGTVEQAGNDVARYKVGDDVYGFFTLAMPTVHTGSWSELVTVPEDNFVARKPTGVDMEAAGAAPLAAITALAALDTLAPAPDETVLVVGAAGGVGHLFVQLAASTGAHVIAPGLPEDEDFFRELGVAEVIDRNADLGTALWEAHEDGVDAILDLVSSSPQDSLLKDSGRLASPLGAAGEGPQRFNLMAEPSPENLERLGSLLGDGALRVHIQERYELAQAADALRALSGRHTQGKVGLRID
jgi:NADPH:quinone reductase-like Zn-dependent oxidoreductase